MFNRLLVHLSFKWDNLKQSFKIKQELKHQSKKRTLYNLDVLMNKGKLELTVFEPSKTLFHKENIFHLLIEERYPDNFNMIKKIKEHVTFERVKYLIEFQSQYEIDCEASKRIKDYTIKLQQDFNRSSIDLYRKELEDGLKG